MPPRWNMLACPSLLQKKGRWALEAHLHPIFVRLWTMQFYFNSRMTRRRVAQEISVDVKISAPRPPTCFFLSSLQAESSLSLDPRLHVWQ